ncbi:hypothetical protein OIB37_28710 [Streptomyces sp. NBC_00820]|uniref:hypothetical protein n=1 Tax=Streptomyces sp. NBC_00820 TaxID=2975842 RepID=UPI002ED66EDD|nr:hypothetical protein OIB37_28710 [Streptomyces sp. NBC_00820]
MSTYNFHGSTPARYEPGAELDLEALTRLADGLAEALRTEYPVLAGHGEVIQDELAQAVEDGYPPNRGRIRSALEAVSIGAMAGTGSLAYTQQLMNALGL